MKYEDFFALPFACWLRRLLVIGLCGSFFLCLLVVGITTGFLWNDFVHVLPGMAIPFTKNNQIALILPFAMLSVCSITLYYSTRGIISGPTKYLDERQKLLRDKAYSSSYKILILLCMIIGVGLIVHAIFPSTVLGSNVAQTVTFRPIVDIKNTNFIVDMRDTIGMRGEYTSLGINRIILATNNDPQTPAYLGVWSDALLFVSLLLLIRTLPRSVIAWKKQM